MQVAALSARVQARPRGRLRARHYLIGVLLVALALRLVGIGYGLPEIYTADNETSFVWPAVQINKSGSLHPSFFGHPASTVIYPFALLVHLLFRVQQLLGVHPTFESFDTHFWAEPTDVFLLLRVYTALVGVAVVAATYLVARPLFGRRAALIAAFLTAIAPYQHAWSQLARTDVPVTLFGLATTGASLRLYRTGATRWYVLAGVASGLAVATKFPAALAVLVPLAAHVARGRLFDLRIVLSAAACVVAFFGSSPYLILDYRQAWKDIASELEPGHLGADRLPGIWNYLWYGYQALPTSMGWPTYLAGLAGLVLFLRGRQRLIFVAFPVLYLAVVTSGTLRWAHWAIPAIPYFAVFAGALLAKWRLWALALVALWPLGTVFAHDYRALLTDTRAEAGAWYATNLPKGSKVAFEHYAGRMPEGLQATVPGLLGTRPIDEWRAEGYQYLVFSDWMYGRVYAEPEKFGREVSNYEGMWARGETLLELNPCVMECWLGRRGPTIRVLKIG